MTELSFFGVYLIALGYKMKIPKLDRPPVNPEDAKRFVWTPEQIEILPKSPLTELMAEILDNLDLKEN